MKKTKKQDEWFCTSEGIAKLREANKARQMAFAKKLLKWKAAVMMGGWK